MILFFLNLSAILFYIVNFDLPKGSYLLILLWIILLISIISQFSIKLKRFHKKIVNLQFSISVIIFLFLLTEITYVISPNIFPNDIRMWVDKNKYNYSKVTEELDELLISNLNQILLYGIIFIGASLVNFYEWISDQYGLKIQRNQKNLLKP